MAGGLGKGQLVATREATDDTFVNVRRAGRQPTGAGPTTDAGADRPRLTQPCSLPRNLAQSCEAGTALANSGRVTGCPSMDS